MACLVRLGGGNDDQLHKERDKQHLNGHGKPSYARRSVEDRTSVHAVETDGNENGKRDDEPCEAKIEEEHLHDSPQIYCVADYVELDARTFLRSVNPANRKTQEVPSRRVEPSLGRVCAFWEERDAVLGQGEVPRDSAADAQIPLEVLDEVCRR